MAKSKLDLTGLGDLASLNETGGTMSFGQPLDLLIDDILEDPHQPRQFFSEEAIDSLAEQIRASKVRSPISVKPKNADGKYLINHGARRYRASIRAGKKTIPAFIDESHDDYDQVAENIQRENLAPLEIAMFIRKRVEQGDKKTEIAAKLGQKSSFVSEHLPLLDAPEFIQSMARNKSVGVRTLYDLIKAYADFPSEVEAYVSSTDEVTRAGVTALVSKLKTSVAVVIPHSDVDSTLPSQGASVSVLDQEVREAQGSEAVSSVEDKKLNQKRPSISEQPEQSQSDSPENLAVLIKYEGRVATLMLKGKVEVIYKDTGESSEIDLSDVQILGTEMISKGDAPLLF